VVYRRGGGTGDRACGQRYEEQTRGVRGRFRVALYAGQYQRRGFGKGVREIHKRQGEGIQAEIVTLSFMIADF